MKCQANLGGRDQLAAAKTAFDKPPAFLIRVVGHIKPEFTGMNGENVLTCSPYREPAVQVLCSEGANDPPCSQMG